MAETQPKLLWLHLQLAHLLSDDVSLGLTDGNRITFAQRSTAIYGGRGEAFRKLYDAYGNAFKFAELYPEYLVETTSLSTTAKGEDVKVVLKIVNSDIVYEPIPVGKYINARYSYSNFNKGFEEIGQAIKLIGISPQPSTVTALYIKQPVDVTYVGPSYSSTDIPEMTYLRNMILMEAYIIAQGLIQKQ